MMEQIEDSARNRGTRFPGPLSEATSLWLTVPHRRPQGMREPGQDGKVSLFPLGHLDIRQNGHTVLPQRKLPHAAAGLVSVDIWPKAGRRLMRFLHGIRARRLMNSASAPALESSLCAQGSGPRQGPDRRSDAVTCLLVDSASRRLSPRSIDPTLAAGGLDLGVEPLEPRLLLSADLAPGAELALTERARRLHELPARS